MANSATQALNNLQVISQALESGELQRASRILNALHPAEVAALIESVPYSQRSYIWNTLDPDDLGEILLLVGEEVRSGLIKNMNQDEMLSATEGLELDDLADLLADLPEAVAQSALSSMSIRDRQRVESVLSFDEESAGGLMNTDTVTVRKEVTIDVVLRYLRARDELPAHTDNLFVVDQNDYYIGSLPLTTVLTNDPSHVVLDLMEDSIDPLLHSLSKREVAKRFETLDLVTAPVIDEDNKLIGRITIDDVVDVIREEGEH